MYLQPGRKNVLYSVLGSKLNKNKKTKPNIARDIDGVPDREYIVCIYEQNYSCVKQFVSRKEIYILCMYIKMKESFS